MIMDDDNLESDTDTVDDSQSSSDTDNVIQLRPRHDGTALIVGAASTAEPGDNLTPDGLPRLSHEHPLPEISREAAPLEHQIQALLFVASTPLTVETISQATCASEEDVHGCLLDLMTEWSNERSGIVLERVAGGWALRTSDTVADAVARLYEPPADTRLTPAALETLAVVAYLQPISRPDVARIRGVSVDAAMTSLLDRGFVEEAGRSQTGAVQFRTTALFERAFGLSGVGELPAIEGFIPGQDDVDELRAQLEQMAAARVE